MNKTAEKVKIQFIVTNASYAACFGFGHPLLIWINLKPSPLHSSE